MVFQRWVRDFLGPVLLSSRFRGQPGFRGPLLSRLSGQLTALRAGNSCFYTQSGFTAMFGTTGTQLPSRCAILRPVGHLRRHRSIPNYWVGSFARCTLIWFWLNCAYRSCALALRRKKWSLISSYMYMYWRHKCLTSLANRFPILFIVYIQIQTPCVTSRS